MKERVTMLPYTVVLRVVEEVCPTPEKSNSDCEKICNQNIISKILPKVFIPIRETGEVTALFSSCRRTDYNYSISRIRTSA